MTQPTARKKPGNSSKPDDLIANLSHEASDAVEAIEEKVKDTGSEQLEKLRDFVVAHPLQCVAGGIAFGLLLRSWFRGPTTTLLLAGGAAYLGFRYAGERSAQTER